MAFGACTYVCWKTKDNRQESHILIAKANTAPVKMLTKVKIEVNAARLGARLKAFIDAEPRLNFSKIYFLTDSEITLGMTRKDSCKLNAYFVVRIAKIQGRTNVDGWNWISSDNNIADCISRGKSYELNTNSQMATRPPFHQST